MIELFRSTVRPILTIGGFGAITYLALIGKPVPDWLFSQVGMMVAWWFSDRSRQHNGIAR